jgi:PAS domain S-box-containing protein
LISILYVDDEPDLLEIGKVFLEQTPEFSVDTTISATDALKRLLQKKYDAVLSDYLMPEMDGIRFLQMLRSRGDTIPFIIFTGRGREEIIIEALNSGVDFYLQKGGDPASQFAELKNIILKSVQQKRAEEFQHQSERRMADILNHLPEATFAIDHEGRVVAWNIAIEEMTGIKTSDILDKSDREYAIPFYGIKRPLLLNVINEGDAVLANMGYENIRHEGSALIAETTQAHPKGKEMVLWIKATPFCDERGNRAGAIETMRDITTERHAAQAIRESEAKYRSILENIQDVYYRSDTEGNIVLASPSITTVLGYNSVSELIGKSIAQTLYYNPEQRAQFLAEINSTGSVANFEVTLKTREGKPVPVIASSQKYYDPAGNFMGIEGIFKDITEQRKNLDGLRAAYEQITAADEEMRAQYEELKIGQDALRESERKLQGIVHGSPIPQFVIDKNHRVISWNRALEEYSGVKTEDVLNTNHQWKAFYPSERPCMADLLIEGTIERIPQWYEGKYSQSKYVEGAYEATDFFPHMGDSGTWLYFTAAPIRDSSGIIIGAVETLEDITERKRSEEEILRMNQFLESIIVNANVWLMALDQRGTILLWNNAAEEMSGYTDNEVIGSRDIWKLLYPDKEYRKTITKTLLQIINDRKYLQNFETTILTRSGRQKTILWNTRSLQGTDHHPASFIAIGVDITKSIQAEQALRDSENILYAILTGSPIPQFVIDKNHRVFQWNPALERYGGIKAQDVIGTTQQWRAFYPEERPCMADLLVDGQIEKISDWYEGKYIKSSLIDGAYEATDFFPHMGTSGTWLHFTAAPIRDTRGAILGAVETLEDITETKNTENELKENEEKYRRILDNIQDVFYRSDSKGNLIMISPSGVSLLGYDSPDELIGFNIAGQLYANPEDRGAFLDAMKEEGSVKNYEVKLRKKEGSIVTVSTNSHFYYNPDGSLGGVEGIFRDISDLKITEKLLRGSEAMYRTIFNNTGAATIIIAPDTTILLANDGWEKLTGVPKTAQENKISWTIFIDRDDVERMKQYHYTRRKDPSLVPKSYECRLIDASGTIHNCIVNVLMIPDSANSVASLVDITELKLAEEALRQINKKLNLMSSVTRHDILNQITALSGYTELLKNHLSNINDIEYITQVEIAVRNIERQISFTKLYQDIGVNGPEWKNVGDTILQAQSQLPYGSVTIDKNLNGLEVYADPLLVKVFYNLIENSFRHGQKTTRIRFFHSEDTEEITIVCEDDGTGIPDDQKGRIFERGFGKHSGFGLFLAREILSITGLTIRETGKAGWGARFEITIRKGAYRQISR